MAVNRWLLLDADLAWTHARCVDANANSDIGDYISLEIHEHMVTTVAAEIGRASFLAGQFQAKHLTREAVGFAVSSHQRLYPCWQGGRSARPAAAWRCFGPQWSRPHPGRPPRTAILSSPYNDAGRGCFGDSALATKAFRIGADPSPRTSRSWRAAGQPQAR
jgi:hypothetical protein